ncbi:hypothetical protein ARALYDRAFT_342119 [Arabidopsis lyrata subsp. lyrata]|uniref:Uncharacterized protein n=1 Tax=Arabidopsis lyrata subsp. lyrata TaxID=81972 RepID=D7LA36_ARALL|nr:uncharacterized protein LOC9319273 [Arabidopsis lyrata subsp. lyrata]XP_020886425.1 uncharacterized protein LOC9319273 [Arabidopsis lyrata subsp. lyrata]EFH61589.1 hypothetical protein ARALYDRAFT_342119 [Arabidopsis lyrata subsp. lyrata]|eukprot:XP_002885330.1 uncharacterized protein LOC9319273 [Arabidopsis lyrata subsp. lyrata]
MTDSRNRWLTGHELNLILQNANSLTVSTPSARNGSIGLFLYNVEAYRDDMLWQHFDGGNPHRGTLDGVRYTESTNFVNEAYRRRDHRKSQRHGILAVVHYRIV